MRDKNLDRARRSKLARVTRTRSLQNYSHPFVVFMAGVLSRCGTGCTTASNSPTSSSLESVGEASRSSIPLSPQPHGLPADVYVIYVKGFAVPHIAAGINLNMPVIGSFLRRGGSFFLRRSFVAMRSTRQSSPSISD